MLVMAAAKSPIEVTHEEMSEEVEDMVPTKAPMQGRKAAEVEVLELGPSGVAAVAEG